MGQSETLDSMLEETGGKNNWGGSGDKQVRLNKRSGRRPKVFAEMLKN